MLTKSVLGNQIKVLRLEKGLSQEEFGAPVDLSRSAVSQIESGQMYPSLESIDKIVKYYSTSWDNLVGHAKGKKQAEMAVASVRTLVTTVDKTGRDNIVLVPIKAQAGYLQGAQQPEYIEHLPTFWLPGLNHGTYRAFEVSGYSMLADRTGFFPGDIVVGEYVEKLEDIRDGFVYILVNNAQEVDNIVGHTKSKKTAEMTVSPVRTLVTTVDKTGRDNIVLVPIKAQAGYLQGAQQPEYIEHLPTFWLPGLNQVAMPKEVKVSFSLFWYL